MLSALFIAVFMANVEWKLKLKNQWRKMVHLARVPFILRDPDGSEDKRRRSLQSLPQQNEISQKYNAFKIYRLINKTHRCENHYGEARRAPD